MEIRIDKTESMFVQDDACAREVTFDECDDVEWGHVCEYCGRGFDTKDGLNIHKGAHCKVARGLYDCNWVAYQLADVRGEPRQMFYRVRWEGYEEKDDTWQNWRDFEEGDRQAIEDFWETQTTFERDNPAWIAGDIHCRNCCKDKTTAGTDPKSEKSLKDHHKSKWEVASRTGTRAKRLVTTKRKEEAMIVRGQVLMEVEPLSHAITFCYLDHNSRADGQAKFAIEDRMRKAAIRFSKMCHSVTSGKARN